MPLQRGIQKGLDLGISLAFKKFALDQEQKKIDATLAIKQADTDRAKEQFEEQKRDAKIKILTESAKGFAEAGDQEGLQNIHSKLIELAHPGLPEVTGLSPKVLDIAQSLRSEVGMSPSERIPTKFYTPPTALDKFKSEKEFEYGLKGDLERIKGETKEGRTLKTWITPDNKIIHLPNNEMPPSGSVPYKTGINFETTPEGGVSFTTTALPGKRGQELTPSTKNKIQSGILEASDAMEKVANAIFDFKPKYQTLPFRAGAEWESIKQRFGAKPDPRMATELDEFKGWYKKAMRDYAIAIQALGKGNLTKNEQKLYGAGLPDPGDGIWPKDAPQTYFNALKDRYKSLRAVVARYNYYMNKGFVSNETQYHNLIRSNHVVSVKEMENIIREKDREIEKEIRKMNPNIDKNELNQQVIQALRQEFGI